MTLYLACREDAEEYRIAMGLDKPLDPVEHALLSRMRNALALYRADTAPSDTL